MLHIKIWFYCVLKQKFRGLLPFHSLLCWHIIFYLTWPDTILFFAFFHRTSFSLHFTICSPSSLCLPLEQPKSCIFIPDNFKSRYLNLAGKSSVLQLPRNCQDHMRWCFTARRTIVLGWCCGGTPNRASSPSSGLPPFLSTPLRTPRSARLTWETSCRYRVGPAASRIHT